MSWNYVNLFELFLCDTGSGERKICSQTRGLKLCKPFWTVKTGNRVWGEKNTLPDPPKEERRVWECENKQLDPGIEIMSTILNSQVRKPGLGKEKYASRPAQGRKPGLERKKYTPRPVRLRILSDFHPRQSHLPWLFVTRHNS